MHSWKPYVSRVFKATIGNIAVRLSEKRYQSKRCVRGSASPCVKSDRSTREMVIILYGFLFK